MNFDESKGYELGNMRILTASANLKREHERRRYVNMKIEEAEARKAGIDIKGKNEDWAWQ